MTDKTMTLEQIGAVIQSAWENHDDDGRVILTMKNAQDITEAIRHLSQPVERGEAVVKPAIYLEREIHGLCKRFSDPLPSWLAKHIEWMRKNFVTPAERGEAVATLSSRRRTMENTYSVGFSREDAIRLDAFPDGTKLYTTPPPAAGVPDVRSDAENWGNALNQAAWDFIDVCPEKSSLLFNHAKESLRTAILKYLDLVSATLSPEAKP